MKNNYFIKYSNNMYYNYMGNAIYYMIYFSLIYGLIYDVDRYGCILFVFVFIGFIVLEKVIYNIMQKKGEVHYHYLKNIFIIEKEGMFFILYMFFIFISVLIIHGVNLNIFLFYIMSAILIYIMIIYIKEQYGRGMYINDKHISYRYSLKKINFNINDIVGIKIERSQFLSWHSVCYHKYNGDYVYCMLFLKDKYKSMEEKYYGSIYFCRKFRKSIICETMYDAEVIDYLKQLNPNIIVMRDIR